MIKNILRKIKYKLKNTFSMKIPVNNPILYGELLKGRCALITGGTSGIGFAIAEAFLRNKADIIITGRNESKIEKAVNQLKKEFAEQKVIGIVLDNCDVTKMKDIFQNPLLGGLKIDILVNNAGITKDGLLMRMKEEDFDKVIDINLKGVFNVTKAATKFMMKKKYGRVINMSSVVGVVGNAGQANYCASKAGVIGFTKAVAKELASRNININAIAPGFIETDMTDVLSDDLKGKMLEQIPKKCIGNAENIADTALFLASDMSSYITGQVINVDGGMVM